VSSNSDKTILVTGITGQQGGAVARRLLADGWRDRVRGRVESMLPSAARAHRRAAVLVYRVKLLGDLALE
jgi:uncharacterized protein YbjT (DUF2867 family)